RLIMISACRTRRRSTRPEVVQACAARSHLFSIGVPPAMLRSRLLFSVLYPLLGLAPLLVTVRPAPPSAAAQATVAEKGPVSFINDVAPILKENCFACHDSKKRKGKLDMTTYEGFRKGGDQDDPVAPGKPEESLILDRLTAQDKSRMPPKESGETLPKEKIA